MKNDVNTTGTIWKYRKNIPKEPKSKLGKRKIWSLSNTDLLTLSVTKVMYIYSAANIVMQTFWIREKRKIGNTEQCFEMKLCDWMIECKVLIKMIKSCPDFWLCKDMKGENSQITLPDYKSHGQPSCIVKS